MISRLQTICNELKSNRQVDPVSVRTFLAWFGARRRRDTIVAYIREELASAGLKTEPDFEGAGIDSEIRLELVGGKVASESDLASAGVIGRTRPSVVERRIGKDPTYRIGKLDSASQKVVYIAPEGTIAQAITVMMSNDYSQLPVMTSEHDVKGVLTWKSIASRMTLGAQANLARDVMEVHKEIRDDTSIFTAIPMIVENDYVLVRGAHDSITGIITVSDLALQFRNLTEPFFLLSEIESMIRNLLETNFSREDLAVACDPTSMGRAVDSLSDLTFGEYIRLLQSPNNWKQIRLSIDQDIFCNDLDRVREIRNGVTYLDPDGINNGDLGFLRKFARFIRELQKISVKA